MILDERFYEISEDGTVQKVHLEEVLKDNPKRCDIDLVFPKGITAIEEWAIPTDDHKFIRSISIPEGVGEIPNHFMNGGVELILLSLPSTIKQIGESAFYHCSKLSAFFFFEGLTEIGRFAFAECTSLKKVTFPNSLSVIDVAAFQGCKSVERIILPNSVKFIGNDAFEGTIRENNLCEYQGCLYLGSEDNPYYMLYKVLDTEAETYDLHPDTRMIIEDAFCFCHNLSKIALPKKLLSIGWSAFHSCKNLKKISIPSSVVYLGERVFSESGLKKVSFGRKITKLLNRVFDCALDEITYRGSSEEFLKIIMQYAWVPPYRIVTIKCKDKTIIKDKRGTSRYQYGKMFTD